MKSKFIFIYLLIISALTVCFYAKKSASIPLTDGTNNTFVTISSTVDSIEKMLMIRAWTNGGLVEVPVRQLYQNVNSVTFSLPKTPAIEKLEIIADSSKKLEINGIQFSTPSAFHTLTPEVLLKNGRTTATMQLTDHGSLSITKNQPGIRYQFDRPFVKQEITSDETICFVTAVFIALFLLLYIIGFRRQKEKLAFSISISFIMSFLFLQFMQLLREDINNYAVEMAVFTNEQMPFELYYGETSAFQLGQFVAGTRPEKSTGIINFQLPSGVFSVVRIDLPVNKTLDIESVIFKNNIKNIKLTGQQFVNAFHIQNDIESITFRDGKVHIQTGGSDPYIILSNDPVQYEFIVGQVKKMDYPVGFAILVLLILIPVFMVFQVKQYSNAAFITGFVLFLVAPAISTLFKKDVDVLVNENRLAVQKPDIGKSHLFDIPPKLNAYVDDQFGGRKSFTTYWNLLKIISFRQTGNNSPVVFGKHGWLFYVAEGVREMVENKSPVKTDTLELMCQVLNERNDWLKLQGIDYMLVIPPLSHTVYPEELPHSLHLHYHESKLDQFINYAKTHCKATIIDLRPTIFAAKKAEKEDIYYRTDSHWNLLGAWYGYAQLMKELQKKNIPVGKIHPKSAYNWARYTSHDGDLAKLLSLSDFLLRKEIVPDPKKGYKATMVNSIQYPTYSSLHAPVTYEQADTTLPKLCMNRDSYTNFLIPYLSEHFSRSVYLWTPLFNAEVFKEEKPDIVISEMLERFILDLTKPNPAIVQEDLKKAGLR